MLPRRLARPSILPALLTIMITLTAAIIDAVGQNPSHCLPEGIPAGYGWVRLGGSIAYFAFALIRTLCTIFRLLSGRAPFLFCMRTCR
jgi:hypothetical protein